jgi:hypothetical protein
MKYKLVKTNHYLKIEDNRGTIAHLPLKDSPYLTDIPVLPKLDDISDPNYFECEMISGITDRNQYISFKKTITNIEGKIELVGKYQL